MEIGSVATEMFHADRQTDTTKLTVVFRNFANVPKNGGLNTVKPDKTPPSIWAHDSL